MSVSRRDLLKCLPWALGAGAPVTVVAADLDATLRRAAQKSVRHAMLIDLRRCVGCQACTVACIGENAVPENCSRTRVDVLEVDAPKRALGFLPQLCNHCEKPVCTTYCPAGATFPIETGEVVVDAKRCIGCGMCVKVCPYGARYINPVTKKADKCTFCLHLTQAGEPPACVSTCVAGARLFGNLADPKSALVKALKKAQTEGLAVEVLKAEKATDPQVFYLGLSELVQAYADGHPTGDLRIRFAQPRNA